MRGSVLNSVNATVNQQRAANKIIASPLHFVSAKARDDGIQNTENDQEDQIDDIEISLPKHESISSYRFDGGQQRAKAIPKIDSANQQIRPAKDGVSQKAKISLVGTLISQREQKQIEKQRESYQIRKNQDQDAWEPLIDDSTQDRLQQNQLHNPGQ
ncbi:hypothetical protein FGO68_gene15639 [Halteria grandinella]|uniref:Uncharacterized protein n=1 Tax=Halteria grandinella TaxID=5974 RepID=A0A8J8P1D8_HALGN|nr:hypothetical protein FGO68_gene15639 [Halteria grandinella]